MDQITLALAKNYTDEQIRKSSAGEVLIDKTLSKEGYAADAKAVGDAISQINPQDGISPTVAITDIDGGHRVTITDKDGVKTVDVMDGKDGKDGYTPIKGVDYFDGKDGKDGADGFSPYVSIMTNENTGDVDITVLNENNVYQSATIPKGKDGQPGADGKDGEPGKDGADGKDGKDGITPHIGDNGNWFIGETDTGKSSRGIDGKNGQDGQDGYTPQKGIDYFDGDPGKTAYEYAQNAGYTGTEAEFSEKLTAEVPTKTSQLINDSGFITGYTETDPTVPTWAKQTTKPKYTAQEVGAVATVNGKTPDENGNVEITIPDSGGNVDLSGYVKSVNGVTPDKDGNVKITIPDSGQNADCVEVSAFNLESIGKKIIAGEITRILLVGDSITDGYGGSDYNGSQTSALSTNTNGYCWANVLKKYLEERFGIAVENKGMYGTIAAYQKNQATQFVTENDFVIWLSGTNNRISEAYFTDYKNNISTYIDAVKAKCAGMLFISGAPSTEANEKQLYASMLDIDEVVLTATCGKTLAFSMYREYIKYCEIHGIDLATTFYDHCHPNDSGYYIMFRILCEKIGLPLDPYTNYEYTGAWWNASSGDDSGGDSGETEVTLTEITATYSGGDVAVGTPVTSLTGITVTAHYSDGSSGTVTGYVLSGTIVEGSNIVTVTYEGKTATITVTGVVESEPTVLLDNGITGGRAFDAWNIVNVPVMQMAQYDSNAKTTLFTGKRLRKIQLGGVGFVAGTATVGTMNLETVGTNSVNVENQITVTVGDDGIIDFGANGFAIPENHTLALFSTSDSVRASFDVGATSENYMYTSGNWKQPPASPTIKLIAAFYV